MTEEQFDEELREALKPLEEFCRKHSLVARGLLATVTTDKHGTRHFEPARKFTAHSEDVETSIATTCTDVLVRSAFK